MNVALVKLDADRCMDLVNASVLLKAMPGVLAAFEEELLWDLTECTLAAGNTATATADEWRIVEDCLASLRRTLSGRETVQDGIRVRVAEVAA